ncbi:hypothetical protein CANINC_004483 [Pichia inconspicua]|uniref:GIT Spa2 homology (SHD) domain-containing protein n=1 Tax=Pichia inconspicua TaxID=52247 RepID=A0A4T0WVD7_9ASCO|nr:hypothetical protein CANINC_004483 [[Candida] inconspicua]
MNFQDTVKCQKELENYLKDSQGTLTPVTSSRVVKAREKLKKLTNVQFSDLSTDVYDEMERRKKYDANPDDPNAIKFLPSENNYHPKRNQARQKLAALPNSRFKDLVNDVLHEIGNRLSPQENFKIPQKDVNVPTVLPGELPAKGLSKNPNLTIDVDKSNGYFKSKQLETKSGTTTPITTQSQIKSTTLVPQKAELTWSSDEESDKEVQDENKDVINRSPSKRYTIATNEVLNEHAPENVKFPVDDKPVKDDKELISSKSKVLENHNDSTLQLENETLKKKIADLEQRELEKNKELQSLTSKYKNYDEINNELELLRENFLNQTDELNELKKMTDLGHTKQLSVEDSREFDTLKSYLDKVLEENEDLKLKANQLEDLDTKHKSLLERYHSLQEEQESMLNMAVEYQDMKRKYNDLNQKYDGLNQKYESLKSVSTDYEKLQKKYDDLADHYKKAKAAHSSPVSISNPVNLGGSAAIGAVTGVAAGAVTTAIASGINHLANKKQEDPLVTPIEQTRPEFPVPRKEVVHTDDSHLDQIQSRLTKLAELPNLYDNYSLYSSAGVIDVSLISKAYASLEKVILYLNSNKIESLNENVYDYSQVDATRLFGLVANYAHTANELNKTVEIAIDDPLHARVEERKRILKHSISNLLSTTKHFVVYRQILPELVLNAALNDVYFSLCSLVTLVKIHSNSKTPEEVSKIAHEQHEEFLKDNATITATPLAFKTRNLEKLRNQSFSETDVRPLRITQRLASVSSPSLENGEFLKPNQQHSRNASPMLKNTSILPMIVASSDELDKLNKEKSTSGLNISTVATDEDESDGHEDKVNVDEDKSEFYSSVNNSNASLTISPEKELNIGKANMTASPVRGKNILDKMKKFDSSIEDLNESMNSNKSTPSKVNVSEDVVKAFDKFDAKRRSIDANSTNDADENPFLDSKANLEDMKVEDTEQVSTSKNDSLRTVAESAATATMAAVGAGFIGTAVAGVASTARGVDPVASVIDSVAAEEKEDRLFERKHEERVDDAATEHELVESSNDLVNNEVSNVIKYNDASTDKVNNPAKNGDSIVETNQNSLSEVNQFVANASEDEIADPNTVAKEKTIAEANQNQITEVNQNPNVEVNRDSVYKNDQGVTAETSEDPVPKLSLKQSEVEDDFNNYDGTTKSKATVEPSLPSAGSALELDEKLARRVSRRLSRRLSRLPQGAVNESPQQGGWEYDPAKYEDEDDEEEEDFDVDNFNTLNPDNTLRELLLYLEHQTVEVIKAIQQTLESIRDPKATKGLLRIGAKEINSVVNQMAEGTSTLMNQSRYVESMGHAKYVVGVLEDCVARMEALYGEDESKDGEYAGKSFKQRSAGIAFDVARSTKELVKTVEEASLRDEIAVLDSRLNRD